MEQLSITEKQGANYVIYEIAGAMNTYTVTELAEKLDEMIKKSNVVVDMERVETIDSVGVGLLMATFNDGEDNNHHFYIMNPSAPARIALEETGFYDVFEIIHAVTEVQ
ncbi:MULTISPECIES: STAS domain-containing protein [unclassified Treponema]|jgi:anti-anti-sigma factor|uniref:STAS domain-containing protein n=1 Tax=unclassified Treponema TaxID=2638727 RepID=UPI001B1F44BA|nr:MULTISPECIES: STAS domain-containing protein [unclassified Treponema]MBO6218175.1 STAS domain-containing protein [Treponema sp.]MBQ8680232.1 STAS domain-containing protein [Treponema sp.]